MGIREGIKVEVQVRDPNKGWRTLQESDTSASVRESKNSRTRCTSSIQAAPGDFRLLVSISHKFEWCTANGLKLILSCDQGFWVSEYPIIVLKVDHESLMQQFPTLGCLSGKTSDGTSQYILESVALPLEPGDSPPYYRTSFAFKEFEEPTKSMPDKATAKCDDALHRIRLDVFRCHISGEASDIGKRLSLNAKFPNLEDKIAARCALSSGGIFLETTPRCDPTTECDLTQPAATVLEGTGSGKTTFEFLYYGEACYDTFDDVEIITKIYRAQTRAPTSHACKRKSDISIDPRLEGRRRRELNTKDNPPTQPSSQLHSPPEFPIEENCIAVCSTPVAASRSNLRVRATEIKPDAPEAQALAEIVQNLTSSYLARQETRDVQRTIITDLTRSKDKILQDLNRARQTVQEKRDSVSAIEQEIGALTVHADELLKIQGAIQEQLSDAYKMLDAVGDAKVESDPHLIGMRRECRTFKDQLEETRDTATASANINRKRRRSEASSQSTPSRKTKSSGSRG